MPVSIRPMKSGSRRPKKDNGKLSHYDRLKSVIGIVSGPPDLATNLDHYRLGTPKK